MKSVKIATCGILSLLAVACSKSENSSEAKIPSVPVSLQYSKPAMGPELTKAQVSEIKGFFARKSMMVLPPGDLVFAQKNPTVEQQNQLAKEEDLLAQKDPNSEQMLKDIRLGCSDVRPTLSPEATFPMNGFSIDNLEVDDHVSLSARGGLSGANCPSPFNAKTGYLARVDQVDSSTKSATASGNATAQIHGSIMNPKYAQLLNSRGIIMESKVSSVASIADTRSNVVMTFDTSGTYMTAERDLPYTAQIQYLTHAVDGSSSDTEVIETMEVTFPQYSVQISTHILGNSSSSTPKSSETYVNGHLMTDQQLGDLFGSGNPAVNPSNGAVMMVMKMK